MIIAENSDDSMNKIKSEKNVNVYAFKSLINIDMTGFKGYKLFMGHSDNRK